jgi:maltose alpha-D-glucosyltransferase/alpha-amylase
VQAEPTPAFRRVYGPDAIALRPSLLRGEQSNTSVVFGERVVLKLIRRSTEGSNPELEVGRFLTERAGFSHVPALAGSLEYRAGRSEPRTLAVVQQFVVHEGDAWSYSLSQVERFFERALALRSEVPEPPVPTATVLELVDQQPPQLALELGGYLEFARLLGQRTAELHVALASDSEDPAFAPEPFGPRYQRQLYQTLRNLAARSLGELRRGLAALPEPVRAEAAALLAREDAVQEAFRGIVGARLGGKRIRCHGDYHLGQVLYTGSDVVIIDFEGEPARPLSERRLKRSPLRDAAGMLRSFDYAAQTALLAPLAERGGVRAEDAPFLEPWARFWRQWASSSFLRAYLPPVREAGLVPSEPGALATLLRLLLLEKSVYELGYELGSRPDWVRIPIRGILALV